MGSSDFGDEALGDSNEDRIDRQLRSEFAKTLAIEEDHVRVLRELAPAFVRARRIHRTRQAMVGVAASLALFGGIGLGVAQFAAESDEGLTVAGEPEVGVGDKEALEVTGTTTEAVSGSVADDGTATDDIDSGRPAPSAQQTETTGLPTTTVVGRTTTSQPSTTVPTPQTSQGSPATTLIESACGSIAVSISGPTVTLVESLPLAGYEADEKSSGPESIEVSFEGGADHCEIKAEMEDGRLEVEAD